MEKLMNWWNTCNPVACPNQSLVYTIVLIIIGIFLIVLFDKCFKGN